MDKLTVYVCVDYIHDECLYHVGRIYINRPHTSDSAKCITFGSRMLVQYSSQMYLNSMSDNEYLQQLNDWNIELVRNFYGDEFDTVFETLKEYV